MSDNIYEILSLAMRYWFALLGVLIVLRAYIWLIRDRHEKHRRLRNLPDAGNVGEFLVLQGNDELPEDASLPAPWEGTLGFVRGNDMVVPVEGVARTHLFCYFEEGAGMIAEPHRGCTCVVDGEEVTTRAEAKEHPLKHGSVLEVGGAKLQLRVFIGIDVERAAALQEVSEPPVVLDPVEVQVLETPPLPQYPEVRVVEPTPVVFVQVPQPQPLPPSDDPYHWAPPASPAALPEVKLPGEEPSPPSNADEEASSAPVRRRRRRNGEA